MSGAVQALVFLVAFGVLPAIVLVSGAHWTIGRSRRMDGAEIAAERAPRFDWHHRYYD